MTRSRDGEMGEIIAGFEYRKIDYAQSAVF